MILQALNDNSLAVVRAMRRFRSETEQEKVERVVTSYQDGSFLIDRLEAGLWSTRISLLCCSTSAVGSSTSTATHRSIGPPNRMRRRRSFRLRSSQKRPSG